MYNFSHSGPAVVYSLFIVASIVCGGFVLGPVVECSTQDRGVAG